MTHDPETVLAYVDGELNDTARADFERAMAADPALARAVEAERALAAKIKGHFAPVADEPVPDRLRVLFGQAEPAQVIDFAAAKERRQTRRWWPGVGMAALAAGVVGGQMLVQAPAMVASRDGGLYAGRTLERALDTQLASAQPTDAEVRIGLSFRRGGGWCRSFQAEALEGIACRAGDRWRLERTLSGEAQAGTYRQAGSPALMAAAQDMMTDAPMDAGAERAARDGGWR